MYFNISICQHKFQIIQKKLISHVSHSNVQYAHKYFTLKYKIKLEWYKSIMNIIVKNVFNKSFYKKKIILKNYKKDTFTTSNISHQLMRKNIVKCS